MPTKQKDSTEVEDGIAAYEASIREGSAEDALVELAKRDILRKSGFVVYTTDPPMENLDIEAIKKAAWQITRTEATVSTQDELDGEGTALPIHRLKLGSKLLDGPAYETAEWLAKDVVWRLGWAKAEQVIWKQLDHKYGATVQRWTRELNTEDQQYIFVKKTDRVFITTEPKFAADVIYKKDEDRLEKLALSIGTQRALFERQMPSLKGHGTSLKVLGTRVSKKARAGYDTKAVLNGNGEGDQE